LKGWNSVGCFASQSSGRVLAQNLGHPLRVRSDDFEIGCDGRIRRAAALLPIAQRAKRNGEAGGEFFLGETQAPPKRSDEGPATKGRRGKVSNCSLVSGVSDKASISASERVGLEIVICFIARGDPS
jgi:hypothetical protein